MRHAGCRPGARRLRETTLSTAKKISSTGTRPGAAREIGTATTAQNSEKKKKLTSNEIPGFNPPKPVAKNAKTPEPTEPAPKQRPDARAVFALLAAPWKSVPPVDRKIPDRIKPLLTLGAVAAVILVLVAVLGRNPRPETGGSPGPGYLPPGVSLLDETVSDNRDGTRVELFVEVGELVQEANLRDMLSELLKQQQEREGFNFNPHPTYVAISAYSSDTIFRNDRGWWVGRVEWEDGAEPEIKLNMEALLPRNGGTGYGTMTREEYLQKTDDIFKEVHSSMNMFNDLFKQYQKMIINDNNFLESGETLSDVIYENTNELPGPPWNECSELAAAFEDMIDATGYFEALFAPGTDLFTTRRFDSQEFSEHLNEYFERATIYSHERAKFRSNKPVRIQ